MNNQAQRAESIILKPEFPLQKWQWESLFGNPHPVEIEIGFGKGGFLVASSQAYPGRNYLGVETAAKMVEYAAGRLAKRDVTNVRLVCGDAHYTIARAVPERSVSTIHIYFPDPWPKKRHRKRRLLTGEFLPVLAGTLIPGGKIQFATDFQNYFEETVELFASCPAFCARNSNEWIDTRPAECITNYETKYRREGRPIYYALYEVV